MIIYCTGELINNGTISMTARGAKAEGEDVYLWKNGKKNYEYIPAGGATGGDIWYGVDTRTGKVGQNGSTVSGTTRATGGRWSWWNWNLG